MVIFTDIQKLLLYQRLNLGFVCDICKRRFFNRLEHLQHTITCRRVPEPLICGKCGKTFGHQKILQLHLRIHNLSESSTQSITDTVRTVTTPECIDITESDTSSSSLANSGPKSDESLEPRSALDEQSSSLNVPGFSERPREPHTLSGPTESTTLPQSSHTVRSRRKIVPKKKIGLTKVRMEDCLRCDACSCIYIDPKDYYKHMRNFHHLSFDNSPIPPPKTRRKCRSCCKQCRGVNCGGVKRPRATSSTSNLIFRVNMRDNIQDRWMRMVSQQLSAEPVPQADIKPDIDAIAIKPDPEPPFDFSLLLSQVEVKIKTEPPDDYVL